MPKKKNLIKLEDKIMSQIKAGKIAMKSKWYFIIGSLLVFSGLIGFSMITIFLINLTFFSLRRHGPMASWRLQMMITSFPLWLPVLALLGIISGVWLLKKYDFSYKKHFGLIVIGFVAALFLAGFAIDKLGLNEVWERRSSMRRFYQQLDKRQDFRRPGWKLR